MIIIIILVFMKIINDMVKSNILLSNKWIEF